jgi:hypothetical protein
MRFRKIVILYEIRQTLSTIRIDVKFKKTTIDKSQEKRINKV